MRIGIRGWSFERALEPADCLMGIASFQVQLAEPRRRGKSLPWRLGGGREGMHRIVEHSQLDVRQSETVLLRRRLFAGIILRFVSQLVEDIIERL
jgi:hypothetical protein